MMWVDGALRMWPDRTQEEIAEACEMPQGTIKDWVIGFSENSAAEESLNWQGFTPPIYNVWKKQSLRARCKVRFRQSTALRQAQSLRADIAETITESPTTRDLPATYMLTRLEGTTACSAIQ